MNPILSPALVSGFEDGTWPAKDFTHSAHLAVAANYILDGPGALARLRAAIPRYNVAQGVPNTETRGYHETLTCFWYCVVARFIADLPPDLARTDTVERVVSAFEARRNLHSEYYSFDVVASREARSSWVPPDRETELFVTMVSEAPENQGTLVV